MGALVGALLRYRALVDLESDESPPPPHRQRACAPSSRLWALYIYGRVWGARRRARTRRPAPPPLPVTLPLSTLPVTSLTRVFVSATVDPTSHAQVECDPAGDVPARSGTTSREGERARVSARSPVRSPVTLSLSSPTATTNPPSPNTTTTNARVLRLRAFGRVTLTEPRGGREGASARAAGRRGGALSVLWSVCLFGNSPSPHQLLCFCEKTNAYLAPSYSPRFRSRLGGWL